MREILFKEDKILQMYSSIKKKKYFVWWENIQGTVNYPDKYIQVEVIFILLIKLTGNSKPWNLFILRIN